MEILIKIIQFFLSFTLLVGIHELGHFLMARLFGIRVEKFCIFFDPGFSIRLFRRGATEYCLGWIPLGGYVKIAGMIDESLDTEQMAAPVQPDEFRAKPAWQRFLVMIAGVVMNVVLAVGIYCGVCWAWGETYFSNDDARWGYTFNEEAHRLGFRDGDRFLTIDGEPVDNVAGIVNALLITDGDREVAVERGGERVVLTLPLDELIAMRRAKGYENFLALRQPFLVDSVASAGAAALRRGDEVVGIRFAGGEHYEGLDFGDYRALLKLHAGQRAGLDVVRGGERLELEVPVSEEGTIGVMVAQPYTVRTRHYTFWESIPAGFRKAGRVLASYWEQLRMIVRPSTKMYEELGGFIAIGSIFPSAWDWESFWLTTAFLSIILAVMNILPIPGLDGGHALFTFWEMVTGRKVSERVLLAAQYAGLGILLVLLVYANGNDIYRFFIR